MGELVRCVLIDLVKTNLLFNGQTSKKLQTAFEFQTAYVSWIESDTKNSYIQTNRVLTELELIEHASVEDREIIKLVCGRVSTRAAYLVSAAITCILKKMKRPYTTVGVDGSVYRYHPHFHDLMEKKIAELLCGTDYKFSLMLSEDGSGRGAALVAGKVFFYVSEHSDLCLKLIETNVCVFSFYLSNLQPWRLDTRKSCLKSLNEGNWRAHHVAKYRKNTRTSR